MQFGLVWSIVVYNQQTKVTSDNPVLTVKGTDTPVQVANSDFTLRSDGSLASRSGGTTTMLDVLNYRAGLPANWTGTASTTTDSAGRRRLFTDCYGTWGSCQDTTFVAAWETRLNLQVSSTICYFRTFEFKQGTGACYNWYSPGKTFRNKMLSATDSQATPPLASFTIASSTYTKIAYQFTLSAFPNSVFHCGITTLSLVPSQLGSGKITIYASCKPPENGVCGDGRTVNYACPVSYVDYTEFVPGTVTNPCFSAPGPIVGATATLPTGTRGCHEYFLIFAGTVQSADTLFGGGLGYFDLNDLGTIPPTGPYLPVPPSVSTSTGWGRHLLMADGQLVYQAQDDNDETSPETSHERRLLAWSTTTKVSNANPSVSS